MEKIHCWMTIVLVNPTKIVDERIRRIVGVMIGGDARWIERSEAGG
jgi:hypothetical protein